jgi:large subunit ribosomal protein L4
MELSVLTKSGSETGRTVQLPENIFGIEPNDHAIYLAVKQFLANQRQGTHKTKPRNEVKGSTKKIKKQKGTGGARAGDIKNPLFRGGGRIFGPQPHSYGFKLNKKVKALARKSALAHKANENQITVIEDISMDAPRTKDFISLLEGLKADTAKTLFVMKEGDKNVVLSSRNIQRTKVLTADSLNTYDILNADRLIVCEGSIEKISNF